jgi:hypothetical protein
VEYLPKDVGFLSNRYIGAGVIVRQQSGEGSRQLAGHGVEDAGLGFARPKAGRPLRESAKT